MSDKPNHITQTNEILQSSALIQRLDRRRTQPIGLINTSQSQRSLPRLPATMVRRFALLDQIQTRYGVNNNSSGTGTELMFATPSSKTTGEQTNTFTSEAAMPSASFANAQSGTSTLSSTSNQAPTAKFRISRKAVPLESESFPSKASSEPLSSPTQLTSPLVMRKDTTENLEEEIQQQPILRAKPLSNNISSPTQAFSSTQAQADTPLVLRKATTENLEEESQQQPMLRAKPLENNISSPTQAFSSTQAEANKPFVLRKATTENLEEEIQRQPEQFAVAKEIPSNIALKPQSTMVLRQSSQVAVMGNNFSQASNGGTNNSFPLPITPVHHNGQAIARQTAPASMSRTMPRSNTTMSMPRQASMPMPEINVAEIAEQVSRILCRQLKVERERRGMR